MKKKGYYLQAPCEKYLLQGHCSNIFVNAFLLQSAQYSLPVSTEKYYKVDSKLDERTVYKN